MSYEYRHEYKTGPDGYRREYRSGPDGVYENEYNTNANRAGSGLSSGIGLSPRPPTNLSNYSHQSSQHSSSVRPIQPLPKSTVTEEYSYTTKTGPGGSYTITNGPYIHVETNQHGPDYRAHLGPRPALGGSKQYTTSSTVTRSNIGGRPHLH